MAILEKSTAESYYAASAHPWQPQTALRHGCDVEVCIIGGGMTGCSNALHLAQAGVTCAILEARSVAWGASGRSGGQMIVGYNKSVSWLAKHTNHETAQHLWRMTAAGITLIDDLCKKHDIHCDFTRGHYHVGLKPRHTRELEDMLAEHHAMGFSDTTLYEGRDVSRRVCSPRYTAALHDPISGHLHPMNYTLGLAHAALCAGAKLFEHTPVAHIENTNDSTYRYCVTTEDGIKLRAHKVVLATNAYINGLDRRIKPYIMPVGTYIVATEPLGKERCAKLIPDNSAVADINFVLNYFRCSADYRLLFGGRATYSAFSPLGLQNIMIREMRKVFPQLHDARIDYTWGGYVAITQNRLPDVRRMNPQGTIFYAQGYSGHGVILSTLCGKILAEAMLGDDHALRAFEAIRHRKFFGGNALRTPSLVLAMSYFKLRDLL